MAVTDPIVVERGIRGNFFQGYDAATPIYSEVCTEIPSSGKDEKYGWLGTAPVMEEWIDERKLHGLLDHDYTITNGHYATGIEIDSDDFDDDRVGGLPLRVQDMGARARRHPDKELSTLLTAGESTDCYDGQYFFDTDHSEGSSGTQDNDLGYTVVSTTAVTQAEFAGALSAAVNALMGFKDDRGEPYLEEWELNQNNLKVIVPVALRKVALQTTQLRMISSTDNIDLGLAKVIVNARLTSGVKFYTVYTGAPIKPFIFQNRQAIKTGFMGLDKEAGFMTRMLRFGVDARYKMGYGLWQYAVLTTLAT